MNDRGAVRFEIFIQPCFEHLVVSCVDTPTIGFSLYSRDHLQTSVSQVFTDLDFSGSPAELELVFLCFPCILMVHRAQKSCSVNSILVVTNPNFLHELAPLYVQTGFPSSDIDMSRHCDFSIMLACSALIWILRQIRSVGVGSQTSFTLSNLAMTTTNGRGAVRFKFWLNLVSIIL